jgi:hypothetical protein
MVQKKKSIKSSERKLLIKLLKKIVGMEGREKKIIIIIIIAPLCYFYEYYDNMLHSLSLILSYVD